MNPSYFADAIFPHLRMGKEINKRINGSLVSRQAQHFALPNLSFAQTVVYPNIMISALKKSLNLKGKMLRILLIT
jgi:hypothetical protein